MEVLRTQLDGVLMFRAGDDSRPVLTGLHISPDGRHIVAADGFVLALAPVTGEVGELAGCVLDSAMVNAALKGFGRSGYGSQVVTILPDAAYPGFVSVECGGLMSRVKVLHGLGANDCGEFPNYLQIVASNPADPSLVTGASVDTVVAVSALYLGKIGAAFKPFGPVMVFPGRSRTRPVWFMATASDWKDANYKSGDVPSGSDFLLRVLVMPMFTTWPTGVEVVL